MYPENDTNFQDRTITHVAESDTFGTSIGLDDGWSFFVPADSQIEPKAGMACRLYGKGTGCRVRGLFLEGQKVYYRTEEEDRQHDLDVRYGKDAKEWLERWDAGQTVWSIEMGGLGPGYEQAIQITVAEILRHLLVVGYDASHWDYGAYWNQDRRAIEDYGLKNDLLNKLGLSGAQWGAALFIARRIYQHGPQALMTTKGRHIQVCSKFPGN